MRFRHIVWKELWHRKISSLTILVGIVLCVGLVVTIQLVSLLAAEEMERDMRKMGKNLLILPRGITQRQYWKGEFGTATLPQSDVGYIAKNSVTSNIPARRFLGRLQRRTLIFGEELILCGLMEENDPLATAADKKQAPRRLETGEAEVGSEAARILDLDPKNPQFIFLGRPLGGKRLKVVRVRNQTGTVDDKKVFVDIKVAQEHLKTGQVINAIEAMSLPSAVGKLDEVARQIEARFTGKDDPVPRVKVYPRAALARGRALAQQSILHNTTLLSALALVFGMVIVAGYSVLNARERRREMGILLAIAARPKHVARIFLEKMLLLGLAGGVLACWLGGLIAIRHHDPAVIDALRPAIWWTYAVALGLGLALTILPSLAGVYIAARIDPAETLRDR